ncbi:hypothetical protein GQ600_4907 [Phytophthora cactorum]|nr:hypothetical protein GQ600_4907 [Phytophthora cactorum]
MTNEDCVLGIPVTCIQIRQLQKSAHFGSAYTGHRTALMPVICIYFLGMINMNVQKGARRVLKTINR